MTSHEPKPSYEVAVVGAGPAGLAAARECARAGLATLLVDENPGPGGQIYRSVTTTPVRTKSILGDDYWKGADLVAEARASGAEIVQRATVWSLDPDLKLAISIAGGSRMLAAKRVVIATGALERPFPIPGWTLPGVMTVGAAQTLLKSSGLLPAGRTVIAGTGPLLWLLAAQLLRAGGSIDAILDTTPAGAALRAAPHAFGFVLSPLLARGLALRREVLRKVPVIRGVTSLAATGTERLEAVGYRVGPGDETVLPVDTLLLHQGVVPNTSLTMAAGVEHHWDERQLCWVASVDDSGRSSVPGIFIAGDGAGIAGASAAQARGQLAGIAIARELAPERAVPDTQAIRRALLREQRARPFLDVMFAPPRQFRLPADATIVCRCEEVTAGEVRAAARLGCTGPNQLKAFLRAGMGPCQGRMCGLTLTELIADTNQTHPSAVGHLRIRPPVKPITLAELAGMPADAAAVRAVVRG